MTELIVMCGKPGSGKSTYAAQVKEKLGYRLLSIDSFYETVFGDKHSHTHKFEVWQMLYQAVYIAAQDKVSVVLDINAPTKSMREEVYRTFRPYFDQISLCYVEADNELCRQNNLSRERKIPAEPMEKLLESFSPPKREDEYFWDYITYLSNWDNTIYYNKTAR